jgi:hypothetical protein
LISPVYLIPKGSSDNQLIPFMAGAQKGTGFLILKTYLKDSVYIKKYFYL